MCLNKTKYTRLLSGKKVLFPVCSNRGNVRTRYFIMFHDFWEGYQKIRKLLPISIPIPSLDAKDETCCTSNYNAWKFLIVSVCHSKITTKNYNQFLFIYQRNLYLLFICLERNSVSSRIRPTSHYTS